jgi:hypothetical protein
MITPSTAWGFPVYLNRLIHGKRKILHFEQLLHGSAIDPLLNTLGGQQWYIDSTYRFSLQAVGSMPLGGVFQIWLAYEGLNFYHYLSIPIFNLGGGPVFVETTVQNLILPGLCVEFFIVNSDPINDQTFTMNIQLRGVI